MAWHLPGAGGRGGGVVSGRLGPSPSLLAGSAPPNPMLAGGRLLWGAHAAPSSVSTWQCSRGPSVGVSQGLCALPKTGQLTPQAAGSGRGRIASQGGVEHDTLRHWVFSFFFKGFSYLFIYLFIYF